MYVEVAESSFIFLLGIYKGVASSGIQLSLHLYILERSFGESLYSDSLICFILMYK